MGFRHALVVGSQCAGLPNQQLDAIPDYPTQLFGLLTDPARGECDPGRSELVIDPTVAELKAAVTAAVQRASRDRAALVFCYVGHADKNPQFDPSPLYLLPLDADPDRPTSDSAYQIGLHLSEQQLADLDGLIVLLDVCHAGQGARDVIKHSLELKNAVRVEMVAGTFLRVARDACFSKSLIGLMTDGVPGLSVDFLGVQAAAGNSGELCKGTQEPAIWTGAGVGRTASDPGLWVTRNIAAGWVLAGAPEGGYAVDLTGSYAATADVERVVEAMRTERVVSVVGGAGTGKSTLVSALARPELVPDLLPRTFLSAAAFTALTPTGPQIAEALHGQLRRRPGFTEAAAVFEAGNADELDRIPALERRVFGPLRRLPLGAAERVRIVIDGLDQMNDHARTDLVKELARLGSDEELGGVRVLVTSRNLAPELGVEPITLKDPDRAELSAWADSLDIPPAARQIVVASAHTWLEASLAATVVSAIPQASAVDVDSLDSLYTVVLETLAKDERGRALLAVLAAAGAGPVLPLELAAAATGNLTGASDPVTVRDPLLELGQLVTRSQPGTGQEQIGLFHDTLVDTIRRRWGHEVAAAHTAILAALNRSDTEAAAAYDEKARPEHEWAVGNHTEAIAALTTHLGHNPTDNLAVITRWLARAEYTLTAADPVLLNLRSLYARWLGEAGNLQAALETASALLTDQKRVLGADHPDTLTTRNNIASWTGGTGDAGRAKALLAELLPDQVRVLGEDHPDTLTTRSNIAHWTGAGGDAAGARRLSQELLPDRVRVLGKDHPDTLTTRNNIAGWTGDAGGAAEAKALFQDLLPDRLRVLGKDHPDTLITRSSIAHWTGVAGDAAEANALLRELLPDQVRVLGADHPVTLTTRGNIAALTGEAGEAAGAKRLFEELLLDQVRVLGKEHPHTLTTWSSIAHWTGVAGDAAEARRLLEELLHDHVRALGKDNTNTLTTRYNLATWTGEAGDAAEAKRLFEELLLDEVRVLGKDHPDTLLIRGNIASLTGRAGDAPGAKALFEELLPDQVRLLGKDHPDTLRTRSNIAAYTGDAAGAKQLYQDLLPDLVRVLGKDHPNTLVTRSNIAAWMGETGDAAGAKQLLQELLPDRVRVLGKDHVVTLATRNNIAAWTGEAGDAAEAKRLFEELLLDQARVLGEDHPDTLITRSNLAAWIGEAGDATEAKRLLQELLPDQVRVLGEDHPDTLTTRSNIAHWTSQTG